MCSRTFEAISDKELYRLTADVQRLIRELRDTGEQYCHLYRDLDTLVDEILHRKMGHK